jgi:hypothetical protein
MEPSELEHTNTLAASGAPSQMMPLRRRDFLALASAGAAAASPLAALAAESSPFPKGFLWGAATAALTRWKATTSTATCGCWST